MSASAPVAAAGLDPEAASAEADPFDEPVPDPAPEGEFRLPAMVRGNDAFELRLPMQWGLRAYRPRVRIDLGWSPQLAAAAGRAHWLVFSAGALLDRADRFVAAPDLHAAGDACDGAGACAAATVVGGHLRAGYRWLPVFDRRPFIAPVLSASVAGGPWFYPAKIETPRRWTVELGLELGAGFRLFLTERVALGSDIDLQLGMLLHDDRWRRPQFGLGLGIFPVVLEVRR